MSKGAYEALVGNTIQTMYTLKQACQVVGVDPKTIQRWLADLKIVPVVDTQDHRVRLLSDDQIQQLVEVAKRRRRVSGVPKADTPLGSYVHTVKALNRRVERIDQGLTGLDAITVKIERASEDTITKIEQKNAEVIERIERKVEESVQRFAELAAILQDMLASMATIPGTVQPNMQGSSPMEEGRKATNTPQPQANAPISWPITSATETGTPVRRLSSWNDSSRVAALRTNKEES